MSRFAFTLTSHNRAELERKLLALPNGWRLEAKEPKRTLAQNDRFWAMLTQLSLKVVWHGQRLSPEDWKVVMMSALNQELRIVPNIHGNGFVQLGRSSSKLSKVEMTELMDLIEAFAAEQGVNIDSRTEA